MARRSTCDQVGHKKRTSLYHICRKKKKCIFMIPKIFQKISCRLTVSLLPGDQDDLFELTEPSVLLCNKNSWRTTCDHYSLYPKLKITLVMQQENILKYTQVSLPLNEPLISIYKNITKTKQKTIPYWWLNEIIIDSLSSAVDSLASYWLFRIFFDTHIPCSL